MRRPGAVHRSTGIYLKAEGNPRKPQLGDHLMKAVEQSLSQMGSVESHSTSVREKEGKGQIQV